MTFSLKSLVCCLSDPESASKPSNKVEPSSNPSSRVPVKNSRPHESQPQMSSSNKNASDSSKPIQQPQQHQQQQQQPHNYSVYPKPGSGASAAHHEQIPLDYLSHGKPNPEELALKGRRHSSSILITPPAGSGGSGSGSGGNGSNGEYARRLSGDSLKFPKSNANDIEVCPVVEEHNGHDEGHRPYGNTISNDPQAEVGEIEEAGEDGITGDLLPPPEPEYRNRKCLVLDLDETLVHSSFKYIWNADFVIPVEIEGSVHDVFVVKRPGVDEFLDRVSQLYEVVVFTASVAKYGDPLLDKLDAQHHVHHRLFRESCFNFQGNYIKNLSWLGRPLESIVIVDNSPAAYALQPYNAVPVSSWFSDIHDNELLDMLPFLEDLSGKTVPNVVNVLGHEW